MTAGAGERRSDAAEIAALVVNIPALGVGFFDARLDILIVGIGPVLRPERGRQKLDQPPLILRQLMTLAVRLVIHRVAIFPAS